MTVQRRDPVTGRILPTDRQPWTPEQWDEGRQFPSQTYFYVYLPDCPGSLNGGWVKRATAVFWLATGRGVRPGCVLHHRDHNPLNDVFDNLAELPLNEHGGQHMKWKCFVCQNCGQEFWLSGHTYKDRAGKFCSKRCFHTRGARA